MITREKYGPWAVVAGGSEGVGESYARKLAAAGLDLVLVARRSDVLEELARDFRDSAGVQVRTLEVDLRQTASANLILEAVAGLEVGFFAFVAAAAGEMKPFVQRTLEDVMIPVQISVLVQTALTHHFARQMAARGRGGIVLVGSLAGNVGAVNMSTYSGAKAYEQLLAEALWAELRPLGVDVQALVLGSTATPARARSLSANAPKGTVVLTADEVVQHGLDTLGEGPVEVPPPLAETFRQMCSLPRREIVEMRAPRAPTQGT